MIVYRNRLIIGIIKRLFGTVFGVLYKLISLLNLQFTLLVLLIGAVLFLTGVMDANKTVRTIFQGVLIISAIYAILNTIKRLLGIEKKVKRSKGAQIINERQDDRGVQVGTQTTLSQGPTIVKEEKPMYFRVKQNPEYVMAEYSDRYELYRIVDGGLRKIRTDYK